MAKFLKKDNIKKNPLKGEYLVKNPLLYAFLKSVDFFSYSIKIFQKSIKVNENINNPKKILLSNIAHLGDLLISSNILHILKRKFPEAKIGFVCSSSSCEILENSPLVDKIFIVDHWKLNRSNISFLQKIKKYYLTRKLAMEAIKKEKYDLAIDLHYYFPNSIYLLYKVKIPIRIAYSAAGFKNYLTHSLLWKNENKHMGLYQRDLLRFLSTDLKDPKKMDFGFQHLHDKNQLSIKNLKCSLPDEYIVFHIGAGDLKKMWPISKWIELTHKMLMKKKNIIFTGKKDNEAKLIDKILKDEKILPLSANCYNCCNKLNILELSRVIKNAKLVVCMDSFVLHLAASLNQSTIVIFCGINNHHHIVVKKENVIPIVNKLKCYPCYMKNGCFSMGCLNNIEVDYVIKNMESLLCKSSNEH